MGSSFQDNVSCMPDLSFPPGRRLLHAEEFDAVFQNRDFSVSSSSILLLAKHNTQGFNRLGMVISKKNLPRAVDRNKVKRTIRERFRHELAFNALDVVALARPGIRKEKDLRNHVAGLLQKLAARVPSS